MARLLSADAGDLTRTHLLGFNFGLSSYESHFSKRFREYELLPYIDLFSDDAKRVLFEKSFFIKLVPIFAKHTKVSSILNRIIGIPVLKPDDKKGIIEELANALIEEDENRKTLVSRITNFEKKLQNEGKSFQGISLNYMRDSSLPKFLSGTIPSGSLICVEAILNRVSAITDDSILSDRRKKGGVEWLLSDFPFFLMGQHNALYTGETIALRFPPGLSEAIGTNLPLSQSVDWYPYVKIVGVFQANWSAQFPGIRTIEVRWMRLRHPRNPADVLEEELQTAFEETSWRREHTKPFYLPDDRFDALFVLYLMLFTYIAEDANFSKYSNYCVELSKTLLASAAPAPRDLTDFYGGKASV